MAYERQNFQSKATLTAAQMNLIDAALAYASSAFVTPEMYGATGDGEHDDGPALQAALETEKPVVLTKDLYVFSYVSITDKNVYLDGNGHTIYIDGSQMPGNVENGGRGATCIEIQSKSYSEPQTGAQVETYTETSTYPVNPAFEEENGYHRGYLSYKGFNPTPDKETYDEYAYRCWYEHKAVIRNVNFIGRNTTGLRYLGVIRMCNSLINNCAFEVEEGSDAAIGLYCLYVYNIDISNIRAVNFTALKSRHISNVGYGIQAIGDAISIHDCFLKDCKNHINIGGGSGALGVFTTGTTISNIVIHVSDANAYVPGRTDRIFQQSVDIHPGCHRPILSNFYIEYDNCMEGDNYGVVAQMSCPEVFVNGLTTVFHPVGRYAIAYIGFGVLTKKAVLTNIHARRCVLFGRGWGYERGRILDANYLGEVIVNGGEIGGIRSCVGPIKIRLSNLKITGKVYPTSYLYADNCVFKNTDIPSNVNDISILSEAFFTHCDISGPVGSSPNRSACVIDAPANSLHIANSIIRKSSAHGLFKTEQAHLYNNQIVDLWAFVLGSKIRDGFVDGDDCTLDVNTLW